MRHSMFRGQDALGEWVYGSLINGYADDGSDVAYIATGLPTGTDDFEHFLVPLHVVKPATVGMKSDFLDKDDTPIYEGDIVELAISDGTVRRFVVRYAMDDRLLKEKPGFIHDGHLVRIHGWFFWWEYNDLLPTVNDNGQSDIKRMKVIGNIYENKDLLNK